MGPSVVSISLDQIESENSSLPAYVAPVIVKRSCVFPLVGKSAGFDCDGTLSIQWKQGEFKSVSWKIEVRTCIDDFPLTPLMSANLAASLSTKKMTRRPFKTPLVRSLANTTAASSACENDLLWSRRLPLLDEGFWDSAVIHHWLAKFGIHDQGAHRCHSVLKSTVGEDQQWWSTRSALHCSRAGPRKQVEQNATSIRDSRCSQIRRKFEGQIDCTHCRPERSAQAEARSKHDVPPQNCSVKERHRLS